MERQGPPATSSEAPSCTILGSPTPPVECHFTKQKLDTRETRILMYLRALHARFHGR